MNTIPNQPAAKPTVATAVPKHNAPPVGCPTDSVSFKGVTLRAPIQVCGIGINTVRPGLDGVDDLRFDYASQTVWVHVDKGATEAWSWTPFSNVICVDFGAKPKP